MEKMNLLDMCDQAEAPQMIYDSPAMKILDLRLNEGQHLFLHPDQISGTVSLLAMEGNGEFVDLESRSHFMRAGDIVISEMNEPRGLTATSDLRLLVTIIP